MRNKTCGSVETKEKFFFSLNLFGTVGEGGGFEALGIPPSYLVALKT